MNKTITYSLTGLGAFFLLIGAFLVSFFGGVKGWPFWAAYLPAVLAVAVSARLPIGDHRDMIESSVEGQGWFPAYVLPIVYPATAYAFGWCLSFIERLLQAWK